MNKKYEEINEIYNIAIDEVFKSEQIYKNFLKTSSHNYKCDSKEQVLIFAQRPTATAVLEFEDWNKKFGRKINKGAKGIAVFDGFKGKTGYKYFFDISDTSETKWSVNVPIWKREQSDDKEIILALNEISEESESNLLGSLKSAIEQVTLENIDEFTPQSNEIEKIIKDSIFFVSLTRLGISQDISFSGLNEITTKEDRNNVLDAVNTMSQQILKKISKTVQINQSKIKLEGQKNERDNVHNNWGLSVSEYNSERRANLRNEEIFGDEIGIPQDEKTWEVYNVADVARAVGTSDVDTSAGGGNVGYIDERNVQARERDGEAEGDRPNGVGGSDEQHSQSSGGNRFGGDSLPLNVKGNFESKQITFFDNLLTLEEKPKYKLFSNDEIKNFLKEGSGVRDSKMRIQAHFEKTNSVIDSAKFLKNEYGIGGAYPIAEINGKEVNEWHDSKGIAYSFEFTTDKTKIELLPWSTVVRETKELVEKGVYLTEKEQSKYEIYKQSKNNNDIETFNVDTDESEDEDFEEIEDSPEQDFSTYIGREITFQGRRYIVDEIDERNVSLQDVTFKENVGFPIFRSEETSWVIEKFEQYDRENKEREKAQGENYIINNNAVSVGTPRERYRNNIEAIKIVKDCESKQRNASSEEQEKLARYVGWGGLSEAFDETKWGNEYVELKKLLDDSEYKSARESTLTAFYTPPIVIKSMYDVLANMGLRKGNILEPSCGIGNFIGSRSDELMDTKMYGVELDEMSGKIAKLLYPQENISILGFENTNFQDNFFDVAIGNVPFGDFKVIDKRYDKFNFQIHDYFFAKALDKVAPGGVIAFITSQGTLDKQTEKFREHLSERAELLGAIRLPDNTFASSAGTRVTSDIIFLQKRDRVSLVDESWIHVSDNEDGIAINNYFLEHPEMVLGEMKMETGPFGMQANCKAIVGKNLEEMLKDATRNIKGKICVASEITSEIKDGELETLTADSTVRNFSYTVRNDKVFYRTNSVMTEEKLPTATSNRIKGMVEIRDVTRELIDYQLNEFDEHSITSKQQELNNVYDNFVHKFGYISTRANAQAFRNDNSYCLLCSLENKDSEVEDKFNKASMFTVRTIKPKHQVTRVETSIEALTLSMAERAKVDIEYMSQLSGKTESELVKELQGIIFQIPRFDNVNEYQTSDEYLSGNVREKLAQARFYAEKDDEFKINVEALTNVIPKDLSPSEIEVRIGSTWIDKKFYQQFMNETFETPYRLQENIKVNFSSATGDYNVSGKSVDWNNIKVINTYGTSRKNAYEIFEDSLNLRDVRIFDIEYDQERNPKQVLNKKETAIAISKQELLKEKFKEWIWSDQQRRETLARKYNDTFNCIRPREYDGSNLELSGMNNEITLKKHQKDAIAHILYGGNTLLAHVVGAGKTYEMVAAAQESKRLGLCNKSMFVVPNHLTEQWASEYMSLYPTANILVATKKDFETKNRKKFVSKIATGDYDAVIIGHSQFEKIPLSISRQENELNRQMEEIVNSIIDLKANNGERFSIKALEKTKKNIEIKVKKLNDQSRKDDVISFEELGVDRLFVDESHYYKNLYLYTKMRNVGGITQTEAQKSSDLFMKCRYMDELTDGHGIIFATGTPISNSMVEMYTIQRYLQYGKLREKNLQHFDSWASTFGATVNAIELSPEGTGYRSKTRFSKFYNLPELMSMFKEVADIKTADMLKLPVPKANYRNITVKPTATQKEIVVGLAERADDVRNRRVDSAVDNMLKITNDGRKLAIDQRLINPLLADEENTKINACVENVYRIWQDGKEPKSLDEPKNTAQLIFCDLSTPKGDGSFNVYDDLRNKLTLKGIPKEEVAFIHEAKTEVQKDKLFDDVRNGKVRVLMGSTAKMGAGTNVQERLVAMHDLDCPWRPSDLEQRSGRIVRQGNKNKEVDIFRYVTEETFDAYLYQLVENKQKFISQIMTSKAVVRSADDIDETALSYAEIKMLATGNPYIKEKMDLDIQVSKLKLFKQNHLSEKYCLEDYIYKTYPKEVASLLETKDKMGKDIKIIETNPVKNSENKFTQMTVGNKVFVEKEDAGKAILESIRGKHSNEPILIGSYRGFDMLVSYDSFSNKFNLQLKGNYSYTLELGTDIYGNITRIDNTINNIKNLYSNCETKLLELDKNLELAKVEVKKPFDKEDELIEKLERLKELDALLSLDDKGSDDLLEDENEVSKVSISISKDNIIVDYGEESLLKMPKNTRYADCCFYCKNDLIEETEQETWQINCDESSEFKLDNATQTIRLSAKELKNEMTNFIKTKNFVEVSI